MRKIAISDRGAFSEGMHTVAYGTERIVLTKKNKDFVALVPLSDLELLGELERIIDVESAKKALKEGKKKGFKPLKEVLDDLDL